MTLRSFSRETLKTFSKFITGAFSLISALAWNTAVQSSLESLDSVGGHYIYAFLVTIIACIVVLLVTFIEERANKVLGVAIIESKQSKL